MANPWLSARAITPHPDTSEVHVGANAHVRFVIASDGLWDVVDKKTAAHACITLASAAAVARRLKNLVCNQREAALYAGKQVSVDDVTILVVDVNPGCAKYTPPKMNLASPSCMLS